MTRNKFMRAIAAAVAALTASCKTHDHDYVPPYPEVWNKDHWEVDQYDVNRWEIQMRRALAKSALNRSGISTCLSCQLPWWAVKEHTIRYSESSGMFAICEKCFDQLQPEEIEMFHQQLWESWTPQHRPEWETVRAAIWNPAAEHRLIIAGGCSNATDAGKLTP